MISYQTVSHILSYLVYVLIAFTLLDIGLIYLIRNYKPLLENAYFDFHRRHGFLKIMTLKAIVVVILSYLLLHPPGNAGALAFLILAYCVIVIQLLIDFVRKAR